MQGSSRDSRSTYFHVGMSALEVARSRDQLRDDCLASGLSRSGSNDLLWRLIDEFPPVLQAEATDCRAQLSESERLCCPPAWTYDQVRQWSRTRFRWGQRWFTTSASTCLPMRPPQTGHERSDLSHASPPPT